MAQLPCEPRSQPHSQPRSRAGMVAVLAICLLVLTGVPASALAGRVDGSEAVLNGSAAGDLGGWRADTQSGDITLGRTTARSGPVAGHPAVEVRRRGGAGEWAY